MLASFFVYLHLPLRKPSLFLSFPYPAVLRPHPPSHLTLQTSPLLCLSLPSHLVTSGTPSQPYWLTWPPCSGCRSIGDCLPDSRSTILVHPVFWCDLLSHSPPLVPLFPPPSVPHSNPCSRPWSLSCCGNTVPFNPSFFFYTLPPNPHIPHMHCGPSSSTGGTKGG